MKKYFLFVMPVAIIALVAFSLKKSSHSKTAYSKEKIIECAPANNWWQIAPQFQPTTASPILVRKNFNSLTKWEKLNINYAVKQMKLRSQNNINDPLGWNFQVKLHNGSYPDGSSSETCQHGNCFFLAWHRMYLFFFERILIKNMNPNWSKPALPYWDNANTVTPANTILPIMFRKSTTSGLFFPPYVTQSYLRHARNIDYNRVGTISNPVWPMPTSIGFDYNSALNNTNYYDFQAALENAHGSVHALLGSWNDANNNTILYDMFDGAKAANDPIFFFHHANVDRYWELWLTKGQKRKNPGVSCDAFWWNKTFEFYDSTGKKVSLKGKDIVEINNNMMMNYKYFGMSSIKFKDTACDEKNKLSDCPKPKAFIIITTPDTKVYGPVGKIVFSLKAAEVLKKLEELEKAGINNQYDVFAEFSNITYKNPPTGIEIYVNPGTTEPAELTAERNDYAASIDLFTPKAVSKHGEMHAMEKGGHTYTQRIKITHILQQKNISLSNLSKTELVLLFRGGSTLNGWLKGGDLTIGKAALAVYPKR
jgi:Common central domain of tyrosinase